MHGVSKQLTSKSIATGKSAKNTVTNAKSKRESSGRKVPTNQVKAKAPRISSRGKIYKYKGKEYSQKFNAQMLLCRATG